MHFPIKAHLLSSLVVQYKLTSILRNVSTARGVDFKLSTVTIYTNLTQSHPTIRGCLCATRLVYSSSCPACGDNNWTETSSVPMRNCRQPGRSPNFNCWLVGFQFLAPILGADLRVPNYSPPLLPLAGSDPDDGLVLLLPAWCPPIRIWRHPIADVDGAPFLNMGQEGMEGGQLWCSLT